jgi:CBS domain-containing protein
MELLDAGHHHLAVVRDGAIRGVVTSTDLMRSAATGPMALLRRVERLASRDALPGYAARVAEMSSSLLAARLDPAVIAQLVARLNDALVRTLARWAEAELGDAPAAWAWLAFGSEGRMEQTLLTDQDNALVFADAGAARRDWFQAFAERVNADLEAAGFPPCPGGTMARAWNAPISAWSERLAAWSTDPGPRALLEAAVLLDFRRVAGHLDLGPLEERMAAAGAQPVFLRSMAEQALRYHPPPGLLLRVRGGASTVDLKLHGLSPIVFLARCYALELGLRPRGTLDRLEELERSGRLDPDLRASLSEAFRFLLGLRMRLQLRSVADGQPVGDAVHLGDLGPVERSRLKESFRAIREWQEQAAYHHRL